MRAFEQLKTIIEQETTVAVAVVAVVVAVADVVAVDAVMLWIFLLLLFLLLFFFVEKLKTKADVETNRVETTAPGP